jgi:uncharacterized protein
MPPQWLMTLLMLILMFFVFLIPLILLVVANLGEKYSWARVLTTATAALLAVTLLSCAPFTLASGFIDTGAPTGMAMSPMLALFSSVVFVGTGVIALLPLVPAVRRALAYIIPIRPESIVNGLALSLAILIAGVSFASLPSAMSLAQPSAEQAQLMESVMTLPLLWLQGIFFAVYGFVGVGLGVRRGWRETLDRLGLRWMTPAHWAVAIAAWLGLFMFDLFISLIWRVISPGAYQEFGQLSESLFGAFISIPGALTIGLSAGIGEEILFRGALQPRLGIPLTSLLFMIVHAQYGFTPALLSIFIVSVVLGLVRKYTNTTTTIVIHTLFNATSVLIALYFPNFMR